VKFYFFFFIHFAFTTFQFIQLIIVFFEDAVRSLFGRCRMV